MIFLTWPFAFDCFHSCALLFNVSPFVLAASLLFRFFMPWLALLTRACFQLARALFFWCFSLFVKWYV
jgi:hypothetical protein